MRDMKMKAPYETPEIKGILFETEEVLGQSGPGGFFGEDDSFTQNKSIQIFE